MRRAIILAHHDPDGIVDPHVVHALRAYRALAARLVLVSTSVGRLPDDLAGTIDTFLPRANVGYDFGSWQAGLRTLSPSGDFDAPGFDEVVCVNDSVYGPLFDATPMFADPRVADADLWGMVISRQPPRHGGGLPRPHLQSWFLAARRALLASSCWSDFWSGVAPQPTKDDVISRYEVGLSEQVTAAGFRIAALYDAGRAPRPGWRDVVADLSPRRPCASWRLLRRVRRPFHNPAELLPRRLLAAGVPFAKVSLLRVNHYRLAPESIRAAIRAAAAGYDSDLVERHLARITRRDA
jgi:lipopolysaccharide biosynthesis protein